MSGRAAFRYVGLMLAACASALLLVWLYVLYLPMAFLDDEYPRWTEKLEMLDRCDIGEVLVLGDSRAAVAVAPRQIKTPTANLALAGSTSIEAYTVAERAMRCPIPPRRVILSISLPQLVQINTFWDKSVRYRLLGLPELWTLLDTARTLQDFTAFTLDDRDGLPPSLKVLLHGTRFPSLYFNSLVQNGIFLRFRRNEGILREVAAARGQYFFIGVPFDEASTVTLEARMPGLAPSPVIDAYMERLLDLLERKGIPVDFLVMPVNENTGRHINPTLRAELDAYLHKLEQRHPLFHVLGNAIPSWPAAYFNDPLAHFNIQGTSLFSGRLGKCLDDARSSTAALASFPECGHVLDKPEVIPLRSP